MVSFKVMCGTLGKNGLGGREGGEELLYKERVDG